LDLFAKAKAAEIAPAWEGNQRRPAEHWYSATLSRVKTANG